MHIKIHYFEINELEKHVCTLCMDLIFLYYYFHCQNKSIIKLLHIIIPPIITRIIYTYSNYVRI